MTVGIRIRHLQLRGAGRTYDVSFLNPDGSVRALNIIAGQIATGKTSALELIDYCLGAKDHPRHPEIQRRARSALIEIEYGDKVAVIERPLWSSSKAHVHHAPLAGLSHDFHDIEERKIRPASDRDSLSTFLLDAVGLAGRSLKQAPTQDASAVDPLSFRDLNNLFFLPHRRMDNLELLHEKHFPRRLKLRQTINVVFGTHDDALVDANARLKALRSAIERLEGDITTISSFLSEQGVNEDGDLAADERSAEQELIESRSALAQLEAEMACETASADELRSQYDAASASVARLTAIVRDRTILVRRLGALRAQYADDLSKLRFAAEAGRLFDPLALATCPSCLQPLAEPAGPSGGTCGLCYQPTEGLDADSAFDVTKEIRTTKTKLQELSRSMDEIDNEVATAQMELIKATDLRDHARTEIDDAVAARLAPFIAQRDIIRDRLTDSQQRISDIARTRALVAGLDSRRVRLTKLRVDEERLQTRINRLRTDGQEGDHVVAALSSRFASILDDFNFPKLEGPRIDSSFTPYVRDMRYSTLGSAGATTLISLAWHLSIFEEAVEQDAQHPGFLMIDSPQKNLMSEEEPDFDGEIIADSVYAHLIEWVSNRGAGQQLILADNAPRPAAEPYIVVRYSGDPERPPYGLIDDEVS